jgi:putative ABC transport system ATP-binding protein
MTAVPSSSAPPAAIAASTGTGTKATAILALCAVQKVYTTERIETLALSDIDLEVRQGEMMALMGPSGSGKSTLLHIMGFLDAPSAGHVELEGSRVTDYGDRALARVRNQAVGFVFQSFHLIPDLSVVDNVEIPLLYRRLGGRERRKLAQEAVERVGLSHRMHHFPGQLSGGQRQRVAIARAVVGRPRMILADEPTGNLDSQMGDEVMAILEELHRGGTTVVMVTHDERLAARTERVVRLFDGRRVA